MRVESASRVRAPALTSGPAARVLGTYRRPCATRPPCPPSLSHAGRHEAQASHHWAQGVGVGPAPARRSGIVPSALFRKKNRK
jgi:hypothetical protein